MAIVIEEERNRSGIFVLLGWLVVFAIVSATAYYLFFVSPEIAIIVPTGNLGAIAPMADMNLNPDAVRNSQAFQALQSTITAPSPTGPIPAGRSNPFVAP